MRLVLQFTESDGCTYSATSTLPVEYDSGEALLVHLMDEAKAALMERRRMNFLGQDWGSDIFYTRLLAEALKRYHRAPYPGVVEINGSLWHEEVPDVYTLDEWFEAEGLSLERAAQL